MDLTTTYMGLELQSPLIVSSCPLSEKLENIEKMEAAGAGAVVLFSLFEEQIKREVAGKTAPQTDPDAQPLPPGELFYVYSDDFKMASERYFQLIEKAKKTVDIPIIGSLNGITSDGWLNFAKSIEQAGADALELNIFFIPSDVSISGAKVERRYIDILQSVKHHVKIPVAVKLNPYFSAPGHIARQLSECGADGLTLFNRFYQPDYDLRSLELNTKLELSTPAEIRQALLWIAILYNQTPAALAATTGVHSGAEALKYLLAGADTVMVASALLKHGIGYLEVIADEMQQWMQARNFNSPNEIRGLMSKAEVRHPERFERANYIKMLEGY